MNIFKLIFFYKKLLEYCKYIEWKVVGFLEVFFMRMCFYLFIFLLFIIFIVLVLFLYGG